MNKFCIILPVRNGSNYVRECIQSILSQSVDDLELIVLENASTDNTVEIVNSFNDKRIKLYSSSTSLSMEENWKRAVTVPKNGEYLTLIGHDDVLDSNYLLKMGELIDKHPSASLYQAHFRYIGPSGDEIGKCTPMSEIQTAAEAVCNFLNGKTDLASGFMMRSSDYEKVGGIPPYSNLLFADLELWIELASISYFAVSKEECFSYRKHPISVTTSSADLNYVKAFDTLISYLSSLKDKRPELKPAIAEGGAVLLQQYCQGMTHRMLRTPREKRNNLKVKDVIDKFREYGKKLGVGNFEPLNYKTIRIGRMIDNNPVLRSAFLVFKKLYKKPILKS